MMSGGDLDGDIYSVTWDEKLLPPKQGGAGGDWNYEPMEYEPPPKPKRAGTGRVTIEVRFFVLFAGPECSHVLL